jgi:hypothetical protein
MQLSKNPRFLSEYNAWNQFADKIIDEKMKKEFKQLLNQLLQEVRAVDRQHEDLILSPKLPTAVDDHKSSIQDLRKRINQKVSELQESNLIR